LRVSLHSNATSLFIPFLAKAHSYAASVFRGRPSGEWGMQGDSNRIQHQHVRFPA